MPRRHLDRYTTPSFQTNALLKHVYIQGTVLEPCAGHDDIATIIRDRFAHRQEPDSSNIVITNDIDQDLYADTHFDAAHESMYASVFGRKGHCIDWVVTNPPYTMPTCLHIVQNAFKFARLGVAMLLRLTFLEPTSKIHPRGPWLAEHPPTSIIVMPRHSYANNKKTDSVTTAWMIWDRRQEQYSDHAIMCAYDAEKVYGG
jgi:hypothetical protein